MRKFKTFISCFVLVFASAFSAQAGNVIYSFVDQDGIGPGEVFDVSIEIQGGTSGGLATYNVQLEGLESAGIDSGEVSWLQGNLRNLSAPTFAARGFSETINASAVGPNQFSAANTQGRFDGAIFGVGQENINIDAAVGPANNFPIVLGVPALLGQITIPGSAALSNSQLEALFVPNAFLFGDTSDVDNIVNADSVSSVLNRVPEPSTIMLAGLGLIGFISRRRSS